MGEALFARDGDLVVPSRLTEGPWTPDAQHGGAPATLLAGEIERAPSLAEMLLVRLTVELLRPVPLRPMRLDVGVERPGKRVQLVRATLHEGDLEVARAHGVRMRHRAVELPFDQGDESRPVPPEEATPAEYFDAAGAFAMEAMEIRVARGGFRKPGPASAWFRLRVPVVEGTEPTPVEVTVAAADFGNGISIWDPSRKWLFINPDLTVHMARPPSGEWVYLDSVTRIHETGTGLAESALYDAEGRFGRSLQSLLVEPLGG
jgi:hypothetical protein